MLEGKTTHDLVITEIISQVILDIPDCIVYGIVPGKQFVTQCHIVVLVLHDVNERELT